jgi:general secretion pathway protein A
VLIGQYEFDEILNLYELRQLKQRIVIRSTITPLNEGESMAYINHRLAKAAFNGNSVFTKGALKRIVKEAKGIPRRLNILCDNALITGFGYKKKPVNTKIVNEVIIDFNGKEEPSLLKWILPPAALLLFVVGLLFFYSNKGLILSGLEKVISPYKRAFISGPENPNPSRGTAGDPIKEEMKPSVDNPEESQPGGSSPAKQKNEPQEGRALSEEKAKAMPKVDDKG